MAVEGGDVLVEVPGGVAVADGVGAFGQAPESPCEHQIDGQPAVGGAPGIENTACRVEVALCGDIYIAERHTNA